MSSNYLTIIPVDEHSTKPYPVNTKSSAAETLQLNAFPKVNWVKPFPIPADNHYTTHFFPLFWEDPESAQTVPLSSDVTHLQLDEYVDVSMQLFIDTIKQSNSMIGPRKVNITVTEDPKDNRKRMIKGWKFPLSMSADPSSSHLSIKGKQTVQTIFKNNTLKNKKDIPRNDNHID